MQRKRGLERERGFEPPTLALARRCSTTELFPLSSGKDRNSTGHASECQGEAPRSSETFSRATRAEARTSGARSHVTTASAFQPTRPCFLCALDAPGVVQ